MVYGINGVNLNTPAVGNLVGNGFEIPAGAGKDVWVNDASSLWIGSIAGSIASVEISGISGPPQARVPT